MGGHVSMYINYYRDYLTTLIIITVIIFINSIN